MPYTYLDLSTNGRFLHLRFDGVVTAADSNRWTTEIMRLFDAADRRGLLCDFRTLHVETTTIEDYFIARAMIDAGFLRIGRIALLVRSALREKAVFLEDACRNVGLIFRVFVDDEAAAGRWLEDLQRRRQQNQ
jgi:hypothetical protein